MEADYAVLPDGTAVIEMAQASGLPLLSGRKPDPLRAGHLRRSRLPIES